MISHNACPNFYRFKLPKSDDPGRVKRCYEIEEHMGEPFFKIMAESVNAHRRIGDFHTFQNRGSLPAYVWGKKLADIVTRLEEMSLREVEDAGPLVMKTGSKNESGYL